MLVDGCHDTAWVLLWKPSRLARSDTVPVALAESSNLPASSVSCVVPASAPSRTPTSAPASGRPTLSVTTPRMWVCSAGDGRLGGTSGAVGVGPTSTTSREEHARGRNKDPDRECRRARAGPCPAGSLTRRFDMNDPPETSIPAAAVRSRPAHATKHWPLCPASSALGQHHHGVGGKTLCIRDPLVRGCQEAVVVDTHRRFQSAVHK